jgi:4-hydroxy-3-polyprenylbenzoate decarboxylase
MRLIIASTGATGQVYFVHLLRVLIERDIEVHAVLSSWGERVLLHETKKTFRDIEAMGVVVYRGENLLARPASGSFRHDGMVILPCSMKTLAGVAGGYADNLVLRAADVALKEGKRLILCPRETPLGVVHLENLLRAARLGAAVMPPMAAFYGHPRSIDEMVDHFIGRLLDRLGIENDLAYRWEGEEEPPMVEG